MQLGLVMMKLVCEPRVSRADQVVCIMESGLAASPSVTPRYLV